MLPRIETLMFRPARLVKPAGNRVSIASEDSRFGRHIKCALLLFLQRRRQRKTARAPLREDVGLARRQLEAGRASPRAAAVWVAPTAAAAIRSGAPCSA